jgi:hypothetical protein
MNFALLCLLGAISSLSAAPHETAAQYGQATPYADVKLRYPDFTLHFTGRTDYHPPGTRLHFEAYVFEVLGAHGRKITDVALMASGLHDTRMGFTVGEESFVVEMFYTTADKPLDARSDSAVSIEIPEGKIVVWNLETARARNPRLLEAFEKEGANQSSEPTATSVTICAEPQIAPAAAVAHL